MYFRKIMCKFFLVCFKVHASKISAKSDKNLLNYNNYFEVYVSIHFSSGHGVLAFKFDKPSIVSYCCVVYIEKNSY